MNVSLLYDVVSNIVNCTSLEIRLRRVLRDCVLATIVSRSCLLDDIAYALSPRGSYESQYRRVQGFLDNERVDVAVLQAQWWGLSKQFSHAYQSFIWHSSMSSSKSRST